MERLNLYRGENALMDYLDPSDKYTPLVELPEKLNPYFGDGVRIYAKLMGMTPLLNVKSYPAFNMLKNKESDSETMIESSSGNTALSLTILGSLFGIKKSKVIVSNTVAEDKLNMLRAFGAEVMVNREPMCPDKDDPESGINKAKRFADENNWFNGGQYDNPANPESHYKWTGKQLGDQLGKEIGVFVSTLGTTGTMVGVGKYLKELNDNVQNVGIVSSDDKLRLGPRTKDLLVEIDFDWQSIVDEVVEVETQDSFRVSLELSRNGLLVGPSSGFTYIGMLKYLEELKRTNKLEAIKNHEGELHCVFICPDTPFPYIHEYIDNIDQDFFPPVENAELLNRVETSDLPETYIAEDVDCQKVYEDLIVDSKYTLIDLRKDSDFNNFHIEGIKRIPYYDFIDNMEDHAQLFESEHVVLVDCGFSGSAKKATLYAQKYFNKISYMEGGMDRWAKMRLPTTTSV